ncbi:MAG TPA: Gfo/Idh/MocA family oxidoreductase [Armatimonadota bacterium]|nr:Gfo/Idh/MocA family oxidoreductase [Armatimonadota bacterium]HOJ21235.1 Gfo/Idh/MocA family oxidoreductase [Armatimonadota bacterium]HOM80470.1 Gfo/Idh/MocA family oxidoreductase [Armatimonadota bacterium]HPO74248.1 Gfo/Idh/MocA family oxidoreductase [Armatimonadota bacterium]
MGKLRVGFIGTGKRKEKRDALGYAMAYDHGAAYQALDYVEMVACADIVEENARAFADHFGIPKVYTDYHEMLEKEKLDVVSICTWMHLHEPMVIDCCKAGVRAVYCEKPMANTWGGARRMAEAAKKAGVQLTFNHQRRYGVAWTTAKKLLDEGAIGQLTRLESEAPNIYEFGTHSIDMLSFFNNETPAKWVIAQIDYREEKLVFGGHTENQNLVLVEYENGVFGFLANGAGGARPVGCFTRLIGTDGVIEVYPVGGPALRYRPAGSKEWIVPELPPEVNMITEAISDALTCLREGRKCQLDVSNALIGTEIIFGAYESSRRRGRVDFPLDIDDNPLEAMVASGDLKPAKPA